MFPEQVFFNFLVIVCSTHNCFVTTCNQPIEYMTKQVFTLNLNSNLERPWFL